VIQACVEQNVQRLVYTSTVDVVIGRRYDVISTGDESLPVPSRYLFHGYAESKRRAELLICEADGRALAKGEWTDNITLFSLGNAQNPLHQFPRNKSVTGWRE